MPVRVGLLGWFVYPLKFTLTAVNQEVQSSTVQIYQNTDFDLYSIQAFEPITVAQTNHFMWSFKLGTTNVFFMSDFTLGANYFGNGQLRNVLPTPVTFPRGSFIQVVIRNEVAVAHTIYLAFEGINREPPQQ